MASSGAAVAVALICSTDAAAEEHALGLAWNAPAECPSEGEIANRTRDVLGPQHQHVDAEVVVSRADSDWRADIRLRDGSTRTVHGESCSALGDAVALIVALAAEHEPSEPSPSRTSSVETPTSSPDRPSEVNSGLLLGATFRVGTGPLPSADVGPALSAGWFTGRLRIELDLGLTATAEGRSIARPEEGASFWLARGSARTCYTFLEEPFVVGPCAGFEVDRVGAEGFGSTRPRSTSAIVPLAFAGVLARLRLAAPFYLRATIDGVAALSRPSFSVDGTGIVHKVSAVGVHGAAGVEVQF